MSIPFWQSLLSEEERTSPRHGERTDMPKYAHTVVIGCGLTGASCAHHLGHSLDKRDNVLVLDQRKLADGATGRNGGQQWAKLVEHGLGKGSLSTLSAAIEQQDAEDLATFMRALSEHQLQDIEHFTTGGVKITFDEKQIPFFKDFANNSDAKYLGPQQIVDKGVLSRDDICSGGYLVPSAGQFVPGKLVIHLVELAKKCGNVDVFTECSVETVERATDSTWNVTTSSGQVVECKYVVHATNGYSTHLLPERIQCALEQVRGQCIAAKLPVGTCPKSIIFKCSPESKEEYLIQRRSDGTAILGGCRHVSDGLAQDNDGVVEEKVTKALENELKRLFPGIEAETTHEWSGIMCFTKDHRPVVGELSERPGQFVSLGYNGHGMVRAYSCGRHLAQLISGQRVSSTHIGELFGADRL